MSSILGGGGSSGITINTTTITGGSSGNILYDNAGTVGESTLTSLIDNNFGTAQGDILYRGALAWTVLTPGTSGFFLQTQGASANPVWASAAGGTITVNVTVVAGGTTGHVAYDNAGTFGEAANFTINSGDPNATGSNGYKLSGNAFLNGGGDPASSVALGIGIGTPFSASTNNIAIGMGPMSGGAVTSGCANNIAMGNNALLSVTSATGNVCLGQNAGLRLTSSGANFALGASALASETTGGPHVAIGVRALESAVAASENSVAIGNGALQNWLGAGGNSHVAVGASALNSITSGGACTAVGPFALFNATGSHNTGIGYNAGTNVTIGTENVCVGALAGQHITTGSDNTLIGYVAGDSISTGSNNTIIGHKTGFAAGVTGIIMLATGDNINHFDYNFTTANAITLDPAGLNMSFISSAAASVAANFTADHRLQVTIGGTTYYIAMSTTAW